VTLKVWERVIAMNVQSIGVPVNLEELAAGALRGASESPHGRFSTLIAGGSGHLLRQVVMALAAGESMQDHESPGEATLQVLSGRVRLHAGDEVVDLTTGDWAAVPDHRHGLAAVEDAVVLLTVATRP
jgi:quercetin dioxygenase-like cupin family protein